MLLDDRAHLTAEERATLERELAPLTALQDVVRWGFAQTPPCDVAEVVVQDEFTHDVVLPWRRERWLAFAAT